MEDNPYEPPKTSIEPSETLATSWVVSLRRVFVALGWVAVLIVIFSIVDLLIVEAGRHRSRTAPDNETPSTLLP